jgi:hypothetical protein
MGLIRLLMESLLHDILAFRGGQYDHFIYGDNDLGASYSADEEGVIDIVTLTLTIHGQPPSGRKDVVVLTWPPAWRRLFL